MMTVPSLATALVYGVGGYLAIQGELTVGTLLALTTLLLRLLGPLQGLSNVRIDVMTALVSFERVFEVLDLPSSIREKPDAVALPVTASRVEFDHVSFRYPRAEDVSLASLESVARTETVDTGEVLHDVTFTAEPGQMVALVGPSGAGKTTITHLVVAALRRRVGRGPRRRSRRARGDPRVARGRRRLRHPGRPHVPRHDPRQPALRPPRRRRPRRSGPRSRRPRSRGWSARSPRVSTPSSATAATGSPAASANAWPSPACCSRRLPSWSSTRRPPTSTPSPSTPSSAPSTPPSRAAPAWSSPTGSRPFARPTRSWSSTRAGSSSAAPTPRLLAEGGLYADLYRTQFLDDLHPSAAS